MMQISPLLVNCCVIIGTTTKILKSSQEPNQGTSTKAKIEEKVKTLNIKILSRDSYRRPCIVYLVKDTENVEVWGF